MCYHSKINNTSDGISIGHLWSEWGVGELKTGTWRGEDMAFLAWIGRIAVHYDIYFEGNSGGGGGNLMFDKLIVRSRYYRAREVFIFLKYHWVM